MDTGNDTHNSEIASWIRHFDTLLWMVTTILATAIGGLYIFCLKETSNKFYLTLFGFFLTIIAVHFASSLRHHRQNIYEKYKNHHFIDAMKRRSALFYQWPFFVYIFISLELLWTDLLYQQKSDIIWLILGFAGILGMIFLGYQTRKGKMEKCDHYLITIIPLTFLNILIFFSTQENPLKGIFISKFQVQLTLQNTQDTLNTLRYFYSAVAQSMAALIAVTGVFAVFKLQSINEQLNDAYKAYKEYIRRRISQQLNELTEDAVNKDKIKELKNMLNGVDEWLNKDVVPNLLYDFKKVKEQDQTQLQPALADYYYFIHIRIKKKNDLILGLNKPLKLSGFIFCSSLLALISIEWIDSLIIQWLFVFFLLMLIGHNIYSTIIYVYQTMAEPEDKIFNNPFVADSNNREETIKKIEKNMFDEINFYKEPKSTIFD